MAEKMKVWLLTRDNGMEYDEFKTERIGLFSTKKKAEAYVASIYDEYDTWEYEYEEMEID